MNALLELTREPECRVADRKIYPYEAPEFHQCWWQALAPRFDIPYKQGELLVLRKKLAKGLITLREARISGWNSAWSQDLTESRILELDSLQKHYGWDYFRYTWNENRRHSQRFDLLKQAGHQAFQIDAPSQYVIDLSNGFEEYLKSLSHNGRKALKKKVRLGQELNPRLVPVEDASEIRPFFNELFSHHIPYWTEKEGSSYFSEPTEREFIVEWSNKLFEQGCLQLDRLVMDEETVNLSMGIRTGSEFYWLLTVNTGCHQQYGPGIIGLAMRAEALAEQGLKTFKMGAGDYFYKIQSANGSESCKEVVVVNPLSLKGRLYRDWFLKRHPEAVPL